MFIKAIINKPKTGVLVPILNMTYINISDKMNILYFCNFFISVSINGSKIIKIVPKTLAE